MKRYFLLWTLFLLVQHSFAQEGAFDSSFAKTGWTAFSAFQPTASMNQSYEFNYKTLRQPDGKLIAVVQAQGTRLGRYNLDGSLDRTFGIEGFSPGINISDPYDAAFQTDGKIVVVGDLSTLEGWYDVAAGRFNADGTPDTTFGTGGTAILTHGPEVEAATAVAIQPDGKILLTLDLRSNDFVVMRLQANGTVDSSFGTNGIVTTDYNGTTQEALSILLLPDGKFIIGGDSENGTTSYDFALVRYKSDGTVDSTFGTDGMATADISGSGDFINSIALQSDGKIIAAGSSSGLSGEDFALARFNIDGSLDSTFGTSGRVTTDFAGYADRAFSVAIHNDTIALAGETINSESRYNMALARYTPDGVLDINFGEGGKLTADFFGLDNYLSTVIVQPDGKIVLGGTAFNASNADIAMVRYTAGGTLDPTFNANGKMTSFLPYETESMVSDVALQADGKLLVCGYSGLGDNNDDFFVARYNQDGTVDATFGSGGLTTTDFSSNFDIPTAMAIRPDGFIVLVGTSINFSNYNEDIVMARYKPNGTLDSSFGTNGQVVLDISDNDEAYAVSLLSSGQLLVAGSFYNTINSNHDFLVLRYNSNGTIDGTFGTNGWTAIDFATHSDYGYDMAVQADGKILIGGTAETNASNDFAMVRLTATGAVDNTFGSAGKVLTDFAGDDDQVHRILIQPDGKILLAGYAYYSSTDDDIALARYTSSGALDITFNTTGKQTFDLAAGYDFASALAVQSDGKILVGGSVTNINYGEDFAVLRFNAQGTPDSSFGKSGVVVTDFFGYDDMMTSAFLAGSRLYMVGALYETDRSYGLIAAYKISQPPAGLPLMSIGDKTVAENAGTVTLNVTLNKPAPVALSISYATDDSTAVSKGRNVDYKSAKGTVTMAKGAQSAPISITIKTDNQNEGNEYFKVVLSLTRKMTGLVEFADSVGVVTIVNVSGLSSDATANNGQAIQEMKAEKLSVKASPNPSFGYFTLEVQTASSAPVSLIVTDATGRIVETKTVSANRNLQLGSSYRPGVYYAQLVQNDQKVVVKLLKQ